MFGVEASGGQRKPSREISIDATRGAAMLLVCLSHFTDGYLIPAGALGLARTTKLLCLPSTPMFVLLSGMMLGVLREYNRDKPGGFARTRAKLADRGLFLLTICRLLLVLITTPFFGGFSAACKVLFVTDLFGVLFLVVPPVVARTSDRAQVALGFGCVLSSSILAVVWRPELTGVRAISEMLVGRSIVDPTHGVWTYTFPLLPWTGLYLAATPLGRRAARAMQSHDRMGIARRFFAYGVSAIAFALATMFLRPLLHGPVAHWLTSPMAKVPPSPTFFVFHVGVALILLASALVAAEKNVAPRAMRALAVVGEASLVVFVAEYVIYQRVLYGWHLAYTRAWPLVFLGSVVLIWPVAFFWARGGMNRFLTLGYARKAPDGRSAS